MRPASGRASHNPHQPPSTSPSTPAAGTTGSHRAATADANPAAAANASGARSRRAAASDRRRAPSAAVDRSRCGEDVGMRSWEPDTTKNVTSVALTAFCERTGARNCAGASRSRRGCAAGVRGCALVHVLQTRAVLNCGHDRTIAAALHRTGAGLAACQAGDAPPANAASPPAAPGVQSAVRVTRIAAGLDHPWGLALLPDGRFLVTERPGRLRYVGRDGRVSAPIAGTPSVWANGQGGLLDVAIAPDFATSRRVYLTYAEPGPDGTAGTAAGYGVLDGARLTGFRTVYRQVPKLEGPNTSARASPSTAVASLHQPGERFQRMRAQDLGVLQGKLVRLNLDGTVPSDNPFVGHRGARAEIWSYGHRNVQSLAIDPRTGRLWEAEHGPRGGDEINLPQPERTTAGRLRATARITRRRSPIPKPAAPTCPAWNRRTTCG